VVALAICVAVADSIHRPKPISVNVRTLRSGDLIFIHGTSFRSLVVQFLEIGNTDYSHVGIIVFDAGSPFVIHADPAKDKAIKEPLSAIVAPNRSSGAAFYRVATASASTIKNACTNAQLYADEALPFDHDFDLAKLDKLYCTALVWRAFFTAGVDLRGEWNHCGKKYLLPADLIGSGMLKKVVQF